MTPFYVLGAVLAVWALTITALGVSRSGFPGKGMGERLVGGTSVALVVATIVAVILTGGAEEGEEGGEAEAAEAAGGQLDLRAAPSGALRFDKEELEADAGRVAIVLENPSSVPHNVSIEGQGVEQEGDTVGKGGTSEVTVRVEPGTYTYFCSVPGHREGGMEGTLTVAE